MFKKYSQYLWEKPYSLSLLLLLLGAYFSRGYYQWDEHNFIMEYIGLKNGTTPYDNITWDTAYKIRPGAQPFLTFYLYKFFEIFGKVNPFHFAFITRLLAALFSFYTIIVVYKHYVIDMKEEMKKRIFTFLSFFLWLIYFKSIRFSSENISSNIFVLTHVYFLKNRHQLNNKHLFQIGLGLGLSFVFRNHFLILIGPLLLMMFWVDKIRARMIYVVIPFAMIFGLGVLSDYWLYGEWTLSVWNYFKAVFFAPPKEFDANVSNTTLAPWWYNITEIFQRLVPPFSVLCIVGYFYYIAKHFKHLVAWYLLSVFVFYSFCVAGKEIRYFIIIINFLPLVYTGLVYHIIEWLNKKSQFFYKAFIGIFVSFNLVMVIYNISAPCRTETLLFQAVYERCETKNLIVFNQHHPYYSVRDYRQGTWKLHYFYMPKSMDFMQQAEFEKIGPQFLKTQYAKIFYIVKKSDISQRIPTIGNLSWRLVYSSFPQWIIYFNINNWLDRVDVWNVYEAQTKP